MLIVKEAYASFLGGQCLNLIAVCIDLSKLFYIADIKVSCKDELNVIFMALHLL